MWLPANHHSRRADHSTHGVERTACFRVLRCPAPGPSGDRLPRHAPVRWWSGRGCASRAGPTARPSADRAASGSEAGRQATMVYEQWPSVTGRNRDTIERTVQFTTGRHLATTTDRRPRRSIGGAAGYRSRPRAPLRTGVRPRRAEDATAPRQRDRGLHPRPRLRLPHCGRTIRLSGLSARPPMARLPTGTAARPVIRARSRSESGHRKRNETGGRDGGGAPASAAPTVPGSARVRSGRGSGRGNRDPSRG